MDTVKIGKFIAALRKEKGSPVEMLQLMSREFGWRNNKMMAYVEDHLYGGRG